MGRKAHRSSHRKRELVRDFITNNPNASNEDVAKAVMVSESLASKVRSELRNAGIVKPLSSDRTSKPVVKPSAPKVEPITVTTEDVTLVGTKQLLDLVAAEEKALHRGLTVPEQEKLLIKFAYDQEQSLATRMAAMDKYNKLQSDQGSRDALGPGKPLTEEDIIIRLSFLNKAAGFTVAVKAFERAFKTTKGPITNGDPQTVEAANPVGPTEASSEARHDDPVPEDEEGTRILDVGLERGRESTQHQDHGGQPDVGRPTDDHSA